MYLDYLYTYTYTNTRSCDYVENSNPYKTVTSFRLVL